MLLEQLTAPLHPIVLLSAHGFCVHVCKSRKDGLPACRSVQPIVFSWTVCCCASLSWDFRGILKMEGMKYSDFFSYIFSVLSVGAAGALLILKSHSLSICFKLVQLSFSLSG